MTILTDILNMPVTGNAILENFKNPDLMIMVIPLFQLLAEEFFKIFILLLVMRAVFKYSDNRDLAIWLGIIATLLIFGLAHANSYDNRFLQILLIQGVGTIFALYPYLKTKNVMNSYILHLIVDYIPFTIVMICSAYGIALPI